MAPFAWNEPFKLTKSMPESNVHMGHMKLVWISERGSLSSHARDRDIREPNPESKLSWKQTSCSLQPKLCGQICLKCNAMQWQEHRLNS